MDIKKSALAAVAAMTLSVGAAQAATTFDFNTNGPDASSLYFTQDGIGFTVTPGVGLGNPSITQTTAGLGVYTDRLGKKFDDTDDDVDGFPGFEFLTFTFDSAVKLGSVLFGNVDGDWDVYVNSDKIANGSTNNPFGFGWVEAMSFTVKADGWDDSWRVSSLTVAPVPVPAAGILLLTALGGLGLAARRRKA